MTKKEFIKKANDVHGFKYTYTDLKDKINLKDYIKINYKEKEYTQRVSKHLMGRSPEKVTPKKTNQDFIEESKKIWKDRFDYSQCDYKGALKEVKLYDKKNNVWITQIASLHLNGHEVKSLTPEQFIEKSKLISDYKYDYSECDYINKTKKVKLVCNKHGEFNVIPYNHLNNGEVCKYCSFTEFSKKVREYLNNKEINYLEQHEFNDLKLPFDFYLKKYGLVIDFTYNDNIDIIKNDKLKEQYCEENYINLIKIKPNQLNGLKRIIWSSLKSFT